MSAFYGTMGDIYGAVYAYLQAAGTAGVVASLIVSAILFAIAASIVFSVFGYTFGWVERKLIARMQTRHGPTYVGKYGFLQNLADLVKLLAKENIVPDAADKPLFLSAIPAMVAAFAIVVFFIPFTSTFVGVYTSLGLLAVFLLLSFTPLLVFIAGWTSGNKFSSISAQRSIVMMLSYEIPIVLVVAGIALLANSFNLVTIVNAQQGGWFILSAPIGFVVFAVALLGEIERPPFDLREADSELIAGWLTDVSAPYYGLALFLDYIRLFAGTALVSVLFLGGWLGPSFLPPFAWFMAKIAVLAVLAIVVRATTVRMRIDRLIRLGWKYMLPLAVINLILISLLLLYPSAGAQVYARFGGIGMVLP